MIKKQLQIGKIRLAVNKMNDVNSAIESGEYDEIVREAEVKAKENLKGIIDENKVGYKGLLIKEMKRILEEKGVEWNLKNDSMSVD